MRREKRPFKEHKIRKCGVTKCDAVTWSGDYHWPRCRLYARVPGSMDKNVPKSHDYFSSLLRHRWKRKKKGQKEAATAAPEGGQCSRSVPDNGLEHCGVAHCQSVDGLHGDKRKMNEKVPISLFVWVDFVSRTHGAFQLFADQLILWNSLENQPFIQIEWNLHRKESWMCWLRRSSVRFLIRCWRDWIRPFIESLHV